jgi:hypothetical protein
LGSFHVGHFLCQNLDRFLIRLKESNKISKPGKTPMIKVFLIIGALSGFEIFLDFFLVELLLVLKPNQVLLSS